MSPYLAAIVVYVVILAALVGGYEVYRYYGREKPTKAPGVKEGYGPPPGAYRAMSPAELGDRGWVSWPYEYTANTASSISHMIERSA
jgi:hypothetical protein